MQACTLSSKIFSSLLPYTSLTVTVGYNDTAVQMKYDEGEEKRSVVVCSVYLPFDSDDLPPTRKSEELVRDCEEKTLFIVISNSTKPITISVLLRTGTTNIYGH
jgi:hypothetical protein